MLGLILGRTVHAITAVLAAVMAGLALGSLVFARSVGRWRNLTVFLLLLVPTTLMGGTLPALSQALATEKAELARRVGLLYAIRSSRPPRRRPTPPP
jgi:hypothetical protein